MDNSDKLVSKITFLENEIRRLKVQERSSGGFTALTTPLTSTDWDGDAHSTTAKTKIDLSAVFSVPAGVSAVLVRLQCKDSGSSSGYNYFGVSPNDTAGELAVIAYLEGIANDVNVFAHGTCPCDANGDIYYQIIASGVSTLDAWIEVWGYWK